MIRLRRGDYVRVRQRESDDWTDAFVALASDESPSSVMLLFNGAVRAGEAMVISGLPLTIDYDAETIIGLTGDSYELEVYE